MIKDLFSTGIRPAVDAWLLKKAEEQRNYGDYWSASSAGYCMRKVIFERLKVPYVTEDARKQRVFTSGDLFHEWMQKITKESGLSIAQELELQDEDLMIRGHIDDLVLIEDEPELENLVGLKPPTKHLILYDYKTQNSRAFSYKRASMSHYHRMQLGTYMYMLRRIKSPIKHNGFSEKVEGLILNEIRKLSEARILKISKDDLRMSEEQLLWTTKLEKDVVDYWTELNDAWRMFKFGAINSMDDGPLPPCTCADHENGFMSRENYNPYFYEGEPCSEKWFAEWRAKNATV